MAKKNEPVVETVVTEENIGTLSERQKYALNKANEIAQKNAEKVAKADMLMNQDVDQYANLSKLEKVKQNTNTNVASVEATVNALPEQPIVPPIQVAQAPQNESVKVAEVETPQENNQVDFTPIKESVTSAFNSVKDAVKGAFSSVSETASNTKENLEASETTQKVKNAAHNIATNVAESASNTVGKVSNTVSEYKENPNAIVDDVKAGATKMFSDLGQSLTKLGKKIETYSNNPNEMTSDAKKLGEDATTTAASFFSADRWKAGLNKVEGLMKSDAEKEAASKNKKGMEP